MATHPKCIVAIRASAGGLNALAEMVRSLPQGLDAAYCIVLHLSRKGIGDFTVHRLRQVTSMNRSMASEGADIEKDHIYIARPNQHLLVKDNKFILGSGPAENRFRPSIDVLLRSVAVVYGSHEIGIILSGMLDDGTFTDPETRYSGKFDIIEKAATITQKRNGKVARFWYVYRFKTSKGV
ncbi:hypothetical protein LXM25_00900 [Dyadobacter sp. LJ53]|uniref:chemotaxis protein CheB n=1 Tax=Dyadobacter chenwenxiniae TaxID=2906456 RepID=UPI001F40292D|nr:chemotaxis protein CheB [Dyadobacter chenwenxiniae]MCF0048591.1 hypothetical protein [Dyadobacter chenwenxiniae]